MFKIRTASKNFLCEKCNTLIPNGTQYFDSWEYNIKSGTYWHRRFHNECVNNTKNVIKDNSVLLSKNNVTIFDRIQNKIEKEGGCLIASNDGIKCYICGIHYDEEGNKSFLCETWEERKPYYESAENLKKYIDCYGDYL